MRKMNHILFKPKRLLILLALSLGILASAQDHTDTRSVTRSFPVSLETTLEIHNKYGKIQVATWDKDSVAVDVDIYLTESSASKLRKLKDDIRINFTGTNTYVIAATAIESESFASASISFSRLSRSLASASTTLAFIS